MTKSHKINIVDCKMLISKGHHHDSTWYHQDCPHAIVPSDSNRKHLCFPPVALLLVQLPWWRFHPKGCSPSPGRDASLAPGRPWTPLNGFQNGPDFWGTAVWRNYEFGTHFKYCQSEVKQKKLVHLKFLSSYATSMVQKRQPHGRYRKLPVSFSGAKTP